ncbi:MAG: diguanylate cyclase [Woeseiaceae bacterium]|nr:diguanylate cyclase [Woeseiaceae bacterium]
MNETREKLLEKKIARLKRRYERERKARLAAETIAERFTRDALHDALTGLANRALFVDRVDHALASREREQATVAVMLIDLDDFKEINDNFGHDTGDRFLCAVAERITAIVRPADTVARLGGDEFAILFNDLSGHDSDQLAARIQQQLSTDVEVDGEQFTISASLGLAVCAADDMAAESLLRNADDAMYAAKRDGKNRYALYETGLHETVVLQQVGKLGLNDAIERDELELVPQRLLRMADGAAIAERAAAAWQTSDRPAGSNADLYGLAYEHGMEARLAWWLIDAACRRATSRHRRRARLPVTLPIPLRVVCMAQTAQRLQAAIERHDLDPAAVTVEISCRFPVIDGEQLGESLTGLDALGVTLCLGDVGAGALPLVAIHEHPIRALYLDLALLEALWPDGRHDGVVRSMALLARELGLELGIVNVDRADQLEAVAGIGFDVAHGPAVEAARAVRLKTV